MWPPRPSPGFQQQTPLLATKTRGLRALCLAPNSKGLRLTPITLNYSKLHDHYCMYICYKYILLIITIYVH